MLSKIFDYIGEQLQIMNPWINSYGVNCVSLPIKNGDTTFNRIVNLEGEEKEDFSFDDTKGYGFYIKLNPAINYAPGRRLTSCEDVFVQGANFTFVFFSINSDIELSPLKLLNLFTNNFRNINFGAYTGAEKGIKIGLLSSNPNSTEIFKTEIGKDYDFGSNLVSVSINARLSYDLITPTCEPSCLNDLLINNCTDNELLYQ